MVQDPQRPGGRNLRGIAVDSLLTEHEHIELDAFQLLNLLLSLGQNVTSGQGIGTAASTVRDQISLVAADRQALLQSGQSLLGTHGQDDDLGILILVLNTGSSFECISIEGADNGGNAFTHQGVGLGINFDNGRVRHLFNANKYVHF